MIEKFKNLDKEQKRELFRVIGWSGTSLIGGVGGANTAGVEVSTAIIGWIIGLFIVFIVFRVLKAQKII